MFSNFAFAKQGAGNLCPYFFKIIFCLFFCLGVSFTSTQASGVIILIDDLIGLIYSQSEYASCSAETSPPPRVMLVPNPTTTQLTIHVDSPQHLQLIQISSMNGEVLLEITDFTQAFYTDLPSSTYFIHIYTAQSCTSHLWVLQ